jgi:hypothetical protein
MASDSVFNRNIKIQRAPVNPLDKATIISIYPEEVVSINHTIFPGKFIIPGAADGDFNILVVGTSYWVKEMPEDQPYLEMVVPATEVARSIIEDWSNGILAIGENRAPGLFYLPGDFNKTTIQLLPEFKVKMGTIRSRQKNWFLELISLADKFWVRTNGQPAAIPDTCKMAAKMLNIEEKPWLSKNEAIAELIRCVACGSLRNSAYPVCPTCKAVVDVEKAKSLKIQFAQ